MHIDRETLAGVAGYLASVYVIIVTSIMLASKGYNFSSTLVMLSILAFISTVISAYYWYKPALFGPIVSTTAASLVLIEKLGSRSYIGTATFLAGIFLLFLVYTKIYSKVLYTMKKQIKLYMISTLGAFLLAVAMRHISTSLVLYLLAVLVLSKFTTSAPLLVLITSAIVQPAPPLSTTFSFPNIAINIASIKESFIAALYLITVLILDLTSVSLSIADRLGKKLSKKPAVIAGISSSISGIIGLPPISLMAESHIAISNGARFGRSARITAFLYLLTPLLLPIVSRIPKDATYAILAYIGLLMLSRTPLKVTEFVTAPVVAFVTESLPAGILTLFIIDLIKSLRRKKIPFATYFFLFILALYFIISYLFL